MSGYNTSHSLFQSLSSLLDPGDGGIIKVDRSPCVVTFATGSPSSRTLAAPDRPGLTVHLSSTAASVMVTAGEYSFGVASVDPGPTILVSIPDGTEYRWWPLMATSMYTPPGAQGLPGPSGDTGPPGDTGLQGESSIEFNPSGYYLSESQLPESGNDGLLYVINNLSYTWTGTEWAAGIYITGNPSVTKPYPEHWYRHMFRLRHDGQIVPFGAPGYSYKLPVVTIPAVLDPLNPASVDFAHVWTIQNSLARLSVPAEEDIVFSLYEPWVIQLGAPYELLWGGPFTIPAGTRQISLGISKPGFLGPLELCLVVSSGRGGRHLDVVINAYSQQP